MYIVEIVSSIFLYLLIDDHQILSLCKKFILKCHISRKFNFDKNIPLIVLPFNRQFFFYISVYIKLSLYEQNKFINYLLKLTLSRNSNDFNLLEPYSHLSLPISFILMLPIYINSIIAYVYLTELIEGTFY